MVLFLINHFLSSGPDTQLNKVNIDEEYQSFLSELGECSPPASKSNSSSAHTAVTNHSTTSAADGGPLALTYEKLGGHEATLNSEATDPAGSNGQAKGLLPTPGRHNKKSSSDGNKLVTWIQKQGMLFKNCF